jgi:hypothetical protein
MGASYWTTHNGGRWRRSTMSIVPGSSGRWGDARRCVVPHDLASTVPGYVESTITRHSATWSETELSPKAQLVGKTRLYERVSISYSRKGDNSWHGFCFARARRARGRAGGEWTTCPGSTGSGSDPLVSKRHSCIIASRTLPLTCRRLRRADPHTWAER